MGKTIELPDPLFAEIDGYAHRVSASPITVIRQAWDEFRHHHPQETTVPPPAKRLLPKSCAPWFGHSVVPFPCHPTWTTNP